MQIVENTGSDTSGSQILHPGSRRLFCHWEALRAERACPTREEFDLADIRDIVPDLVILERDHVRRGFRYRLAGGNVCSLMKVNLTGTNALAGWDGFESEIISKHLIQTVSNLQPTLFRARLTTNTRQQVAAEFIGLPIRKRGSERLEIIGGLFSFRPVHGLDHESIVSRELLSIRSVWTEYQNAATAPRVPTGHRFKVITGGLSK